MSPEPQTSAQTPPPAEDSARPAGTLAVVGVLLLSISTLWLLVLAILEGRS